MTLDEVLERFPDAVETGGSWKARCPAHEDRNPSLSISRGDDGRVLLHCHAGCEFEEICSAAGLKPADLFPASTSTELDRYHAKQEPPRKPGKVYQSGEAAIASLERKEGPTAGRWPYHDATGEIVGWVCRWDKPDGGKTFRPIARIPDGWQVAGMPEPHPLYRLPELSKPGRVVFVCEGEKAADAALSIGLVATTSPGGAKAGKNADWSPMAGREVVILPDNDRPGRKYAEDVAGILTSLDPPAVVRIVELPGLPEKGDIVDWLALQGEAAEPDDLVVQIETLADHASEVQPPQRNRPGETRSGAVVVRLSEVTEAPLEWLWPGRIPLGKLTLLAGDPGLGKSFVTVDMAARVSTGSPWPDLPGIRQPVGSVVMFNSEDDTADTVLPRLKRAGGDPSRVLALEGVATTSDGGETHTRGFSLDLDLSKLSEVIEANPDTRLVVIDPISAYCGSTDSHNNAEVRAMLAPLAQLASRFRVAIVMVTHHSKGSGGKAVYRAMGSLAFAAAARAVWNVVKDHDDESRRLILLAKMNVSEETKGLAYRLADGCVGWEESPVTMTADEHLELEDHPKSRANGAGAELERAVAWLTETLADGPRLASIVEQLADDEDISKATLRRAKRAAKVKSDRKGFGRGSEVWWALPGSSEEVGEPSAIDDSFS
jgi:putative DNA primase/helicase